MTENEPTKTFTYGDKIRAMSNEEMARYFRCLPCAICADYMIDSTNCDKNCESRILVGLSREAAR